MTNFPKIKADRRSSVDHFHISGVPLQLRLGDFWSWAFSDHTNNALRGVLVEFLVASALEITDGCRVGWNAFDLQWGKLRIEVKSSAYIQSWQQARPSRITFDIARKRGWDADTNVTASSPVRAADIYVFALLDHGDQVPLDPTDLNQWTFLVVAKPALDELGAQKTISLPSLKRLPHEQVPYGDLHLACERLKARL